MNRTLFASLFLFLTVVVAPAAEPVEASVHRGSAGRIAYQYVGRVALDFSRGTGIVYGYLSQFADAKSATLFNGSPAEATAYLTFRADIAFQPLPPNGEISANNFAVMPSLITPGTFRVYYTANPNHNWADPATFASGVLVAEFARSEEMFTLIGNSSTNTATATLRGASTFALGGVDQSFFSLAPYGVNNITTANSTPVLGSTPINPIFAFAGYATVIGR